MRAKLRAMLLIIAAFGAFAVPASAQTARGEKSFGVKAGYMSRNRSVLAGLMFEYSFSRHFRAAPQLGVVFRNHNEDALLVDLDFHFPVSLGGERASFYPIVGLGFNSWAIHGRKHDEEVPKDVITHRNRLGGNFGGGFDFRLTDSLKLRAEAKYALNKSFSNVQIVAGISYIF